MIKEFRAFLMRGNLLELASAFIMGVAFSQVVNAFTEGIIGGIIGAIFGETSFSAVHFTINGSVIAIGAFINQAINFVIVGFVLFMIIKAFNKVMPAKEAAATTRPCPFCKTDIALDATRCAHCTSEVASAT